VGRRFDADAGFTGGSVRSQGPVEIEKTEDDELFWSYRSGKQFSFSRAVADGNYSLWLEFAEPMASAAGERTFDVWAEGKQVLDDYDILADAGAAQTAVAKCFNVAVSDGSIDVDFRGVVGEAMVSAVVLVPTDVPAAAKPYSWQALSPGGQMVVSQTHLKMIGQAILLYANENRGRYPRDLATLVETVDLPHEFCANPRTSTGLPRGELSRPEQSAWVDSLHDYIYLGFGKFSSLPAEEVVAYENPDRVVGGISVLLGDGHVENWDRGLAAQRIGFPLADPSDPPPWVNPSDYVRNPRIMASAGNLWQIARGLWFYANERKGVFPPDFGFLLEAGYVNDLHTFLNPRDSSPPPPDGMTPEEQVAWVNAQSDYVYLRPARRYVALDIAIACENPSEMADGILVLFTDGHTEFREMRWALETLARGKADQAR
jgi:hypothetical protein